MPISLDFNEISKNLSAIRNSFMTVTNDKFLKNSDLKLLEEKDKSLSCKKCKQNFLSFVRLTLMLFLAKTKFSFKLDGKNWMGRKSPATF